MSVKEQIRELEEEIRQLERDLEEAEREGYDPIIKDAIKASIADKKKILEDLKRSTRSW